MITFLWMSLRRFTEMCGTGEVDSFVQMQLLLHQFLLSALSAACASRHAKAQPWMDAPNTCVRCRS